MRAVTVVKRGRRRQLAITDHAPPEAQPGDVLVAVKAVSLNNGEVRGAYAAQAGHRPGWDFAGVVQAAPPNSAFDRGDRVVGLKFEGAWAEQVCVPARFLARIPDDVRLEAAAVLPVAGLTAAIALSKKQLAVGGKVLVTAATGGVGLLAVQMASAKGLIVTAYARSRSDHALLKRLGANIVAADEDEAELAGPYDLILEGVGGHLLGKALSWLAPRGLCVQFGDAGGDELTTFDAKSFRLGDGGDFGGTGLYGFFLIEELTRPDPVDASALLADLSRRISAGTLDPVIGREGSWQEIDEVARALLDRGFKGKAVLRVG